MDRIKIHFIALILAICIIFALAYTGTRSVWTAQGTTTAPAIQAAISSPIPTPESGVVWTRFGYCITYPPLGVVTIRSCMAEQLGTPVPAIPVEDTHYSHYPRTTILVWSPIADATGYQLEIETGRRVNGLVEWQETQTHMVKESCYTFTISEPLTCRWRVTAVDNTLTYATSGPSDWQTLTYSL